MAEFFATNKGTIVGTAGEDRLTMTYNTTTNDVWLTDLVDNGGGRVIPPFLVGSTCRITRLVSVSLRV